MAPLLEQARMNIPNASKNDTQRAVRILAKSLFRELRESGFQHKDVLALSTELVGLITTELSTQAQPVAPAVKPPAQPTRIAG
jgi:hypothetical protein